MRFLSSVIAFVLGLATLGVGMDQLIGWTPQQTQTASSDVSAEAPLTIVTESVVDPDQGREDFTIEADGEFTIALARTDDIEAWVDDAAHTRLSGVEQGADGPEVTTEFVEGETTVPDPADSDLWAALETAEGSLDYRWSTPDASGEWALLLFADGEEPAPTAVSTEVQEQPNQALGIVLIVVGAVLILFALWLLYRALGARQKQKDQALVAVAYDPAESADAEAEKDGPEPRGAESSSDRGQTANRTDEVEAPGEDDPTETHPAVPADVSPAEASPAEGDSAEEHSTEDDPATEHEEDDPAENDPAEEEPAESAEGDPADDSTGTAPRRRWKNGSMATAAIAAVALSPAAGLGTAGLGPTAGLGAVVPFGTLDEEAEERPEPEQVPEDGDAAEGEVDVEGEMSADGHSVLLESQLERILSDIADAVEAGDDQLDAELLTQRMDGNALENRELAYRNNELADSSLPGPIGTEVQAAAVTSEPGFPRQAVVITQHDQAEVPSILVIEQESARQNYQLVEVTPMVPGTEFPGISAEEGGTQELDADDETARLSPSDAVDGTAEYFSDPEHDFGGTLAQSPFVEDLHDYYSSMQQDAAGTEISFPDPEVREDVYALELPDGSVVAAGSFDMNVLMSPAGAGDEIVLGEETLVGELAETTSTTSPTQITNRETVVLHIPPEEDEEAVLIGINDVVSEVEVDASDSSDASEGD